MHVTLNTPQLTTRVWNLDVTDRELRLLDAFRLLTKKEQKALLSLVRKATKAKQKSL